MIVFARGWQIFRVILHFENADRDQCFSLSNE